MAERHAKKMYGGVVKWLHAFLIMEVHSGEWSASRLYRNYEFTYC